MRSLLLACMLVLVSQSLYAQDISQNDDRGVSVGNNAPGYCPWERPEDGGYEWNQPSNYAVGGQIAWSPPPKPDNTNPWMAVFLVVGSVVGLLALFMWRIRKRTLAA